MKITLVLLLAFCNLAIAQNAKVKVNKNNSNHVVVNKQAKARMQVGNKHNDKFTQKYNYQNNNQTIVCASDRNRRNHCRVDTRYGVNFLRQISNSTCNRNWGYDQNGIWVDNGCRAEFSVNFGWDQAGSEGNIMVCESHRHQRNYCPAYLNGRDVFLLRQVSESSCVNNWGYDQNGVWVDNGCRAEFVVEDRHWNQNDVIVCSSRNMGFQGCQADTRGGVEFVRQISRASCNGNWGYDRQGIWVANGCRAKFRLIPFQQRNFGNNSRSTVKCSSKGHRRKTCHADTSGGVQLKRQHSKASCAGNWGFTSNQIWVENGCRATFQLYINGNYNGNGNNRGYGNNGGYGNNNSNNNGNNNGYGNNNGNTNGYGNQNQNNQIICSSHNLKRNTCSIPTGSKVELHRQLSKTSCRGNWGYNRREIWVNNGCRAEFGIF